MISDHVRQTLPRDVLQYMRKGGELPGCEHAETVAALKEGFRQVQRDLMAKPHLGVQLSGTTATVVVHDHIQERLTVSHVGDSTAVLVRRKAGGGEHDLEAVALTRDHKPELEDEKVRIEKSGGRVTFDGYCHRVVKKHGSTPGLNMSRSLGDGVAHRVCGVAEEPEVSEYSLGPEDHALLVCSDGIWEVISPQEAAEILKDFGQWQAMAAAKRLADLATSRWMAGTNGEVTDDITAVVAFLQPEFPNLLRAETCTTMAPSLPSSTASEDHLNSPSRTCAALINSTGSSNTSCRSGNLGSSSDDASPHSGHSSSSEGGGGRFHFEPPEEKDEEQDQKAPRT
jgi:serine/threonine protein phosphatase PrpC